MNQEESLSILTQKPSNAKNAIIQKLSRQWPMTIRQLDHALKREFGLNVTYQAIHKALQGLKREGIVNKSKEGWHLSHSWLQTQENFIQVTKQKYSGNTNHYQIDLNSTTPQIFHFDNHTDFSVETAKLVANGVFYKTIEPAHFVLEYGWWTFKFKFEHLLLLFSLMQSSPKSTYLIQKVTPFGKWIQKQYERVGGTGKIGVKMNVHDDFLIQGDWIVQVHFRNEDKKIIRKYWNKWENLEDTFKEFGMKEEPKMEITATVTKNRIMAKFIVSECVKALAIK